MKKRYKILLILSGIIFSILIYYWHFGTKSGDPIWNENKTYYLQAYRTFSIGEQIAIPGQGSGVQWGYYILYNKDGKRLGRSKKINISLAEIHWLTREAIIMGDTDEALKLE